MISFDFGKNWDSFSKKALSKEKIEQARNNFRKLVKDLDLYNKEFLDIGFGQGLSICLASEMGAKVVGCDINPKCKIVFKKNQKKFFSCFEKSNIHLVVGSIINPEVLKKLRKFSQNGSYDIVHSWGVLHHTGNLKQAFANTVSLVKLGGYLIVAIYNKHWSSPLWRLIKRFYNLAPNVIKNLLINFFLPVIAFAKFLVTKKNPLSTKRGMDFYYDVIDWVGGYPYEYASTDEVTLLAKKLNLKCLKIFKAEVPTGCNEFVFVKNHPHKDHL